MSNSRYIKTIIIVAFIFLSFILLSSCSAGENSQSEIAETEDSEAFEGSKDFDALLTQAKGTTVTFYGWGGDERRNKWLSTELANALKEKYDITLEPVPMDIDQILNKLLGEKQAGAETGSIDVIWINGENFFTAKENDLLYGPFLEDLPNYKAYIDEDDPETNFDFGYPIEGYEAPYGKAQIVFLYDSAKTPETPVNTEEFLEYVKKYKGMVTYPAPPDFTGSAFVRNIIYDICGHEQFMDMEADKETVREAVKPAMGYLRELNPYLWNEGKTFPSASAEQDNMFADGELVFNVSYEPYSVAASIEEGIYPATVKSYIFNNGTIGNTNYTAIAQNAPNKAGAMAVINYLLSAESQASQFEILKALPVADNGKLSEEEIEIFKNIGIGSGTLSQEELLSKRLPEMPSSLVPIIEEIWLEEVAGKPE